MIEKRFEYDGEGRKERGGREKREMNINDIDEVQANNEIHVENFNLYDCKSALSTPRIQGLLSSTL